MMPIDDGTAVHYLAVEKGVPVYSSDEQVVGTVVEVLDNHREHIMDGVVFDDPDGVRRFVDAPEVARTAERALTLNIPASEVDAYPAMKAGAVPDKGSSSFLGRLFGR